MIRICSWCQKRLGSHKKAHPDPTEMDQISHGICPSCLQNYFPQIAKKITSQLMQHRSLFF